MSSPIGQPSNLPGIARWNIRRGADEVRFEMELDPLDFTEKAILDH